MTCSAVIGRLGCQIKGSGRVLDDIESLWESRVSLNGLASDLSANVSTLVVHFSMLTDYFIAMATYLCHRPHSFLLSHSQQGACCLLC